jgi:hypothetical protein
MPRIRMQWPSRKQRLHCRSLMTILLLIIILNIIIATASSFVKGYLRLYVFVLTNLYCLPHTAGEIGTSSGGVFPHNVFFDMMESELSFLE